MRLQRPLNYACHCQQTLSIICNWRGKQKKKIKKKERKGNKISFRWYLCKHFSWIKILLQTAAHLNFIILKSLYFFFFFYFLLFPFYYHTTLTFIFYFIFFSFFSFCILWHYFFSYYYYYNSVDTAESWKFANSDVIPATGIMVFGKYGNKVNNNIFFRSLLFIFFSLYFLCFYFCFCLGLKKKMEIFCHKTATAQQVNNKKVKNWKTQKPKTFNCGKNFIY